MKGTVHQNLDELYGVEKQKDTTSYAGYYTDDYPEIVIENNNAQNEVRALVLKDSFANAIVPHLAQSFKHTSILDLRHYHEKMYINTFKTTTLTWYCLCIVIRI